MPVTAQATFCATLVDEWVRAGVRHAVVAPGSRSTPLALALASDERLRVDVFHDERAAAFAALGVGLATGVPAVLVCTSGTAAAHLHAAVIEADLAAVPLLACTADRPPELRDVGAPQTVDQRDLYGRAVRWSFDPGAADAAIASSWRSIAAQAFLAATGAPPGPVQLNLAFRDPLVAEAGALPPGRAGGQPWTRRRHERSPVARVELERALVVGRGRHEAPVLADVTSGLTGVAHADPILRHAATAARLRPANVVRVGRPPASRVVNEWLARCGAEEHIVSVQVSDPARTAHVWATGTELEVVTEPAYLDQWTAADAAAETAISEVLAGLEQPTEPAAARAFIAALAPGAHAVVASSMPVRDVEWFAPRRADIVVHANRGANGIDGTIATAIGVAAATTAPTAALLGDVAFLHDSTALIGIRDRGIDLTLVVIDNAGGGIFSFLPQAQAIDRPRFEQLFGTPHGVRPEELAAVHGIASLTAEEAGSIEAAIASTVAAGGVWLVVVRTDRRQNVQVHDDLTAAVAKALDELA